MSAKQMACLSALTLTCFECTQDCSRRPCVQTGTARAGVWYLQFMALNRLELAYNISDRQWLSVMFQTFWNHQLTSTNRNIGTMQSTNSLWPSCPTGWFCDPAGARTPAVHGDERDERPKVDSWGSQTNGGPQLIKSFSLYIDNIEVYVVLM